MATGSSTGTTDPEVVSDYSTIGECEHQAANVHGVLRNLSPVKHGKKSSFFDGELSDGSCRLRLVGFRAEQRKRLLEFSEGEVAVEINNCQLKRSKQGHQIEAVLKGASVIKGSPKNFNMENDPKTREVAIKDIEQLSDYNRVTVKVKVLDKASAERVGEVKKQDVTVADASDSICVTLWEEKIDQLEPGKCYKLTEFMVREFNLRKYLTLARQLSQIENIPDIGDVTVPTKSTDSEIAIRRDLRNVDIIAIEELMIFKGCPKCSGRIDPLTPPGGRCSKQDCGIFVRVDRCSIQVNVKLLFQSETTKERKTLLAFGDIVARMVGHSDFERIQSKDFLKINRFKSLTFSDNKIIDFSTEDETQL